MEFDSEALRWMLSVVDAVNSVQAAKELSYGWYSLGEIPIVFEDDPTGFSITPSEFDPDKLVIRYDEEKWRNKPAAE